MGLDFASIKDGPGAAMYVLYDGTFQQQKKWETFLTEVKAKSEHQVLLLSVNDRQGEQVRDFYDFSPDQLPVVMIVRDNDEIAYSWTGTEHVDQGQAVELLNQISS